MRASVIVPALDEAESIVAALAPLQRLRRDGHELIVVDGGSRDATLALAAPLADRAFIAPRGRALQMNAGAAVAAGDVLVFLHADSRLEAIAVDEMLDRMARMEHRWGRFDVAIDGSSPALRLVAAAMNMRSRITAIATGDQAMFVERALFAEVGGFPDQPLMEDVELSRRLERAGGRPLCARGRVVTSGRRWDRHGTWRTVAAMWRLRLAYWRGADVEALADRYAALGRRVAIEAKGAARGPANESPGDGRSAPTLQIFARAPVAGAVKTRLAATIGAAAAAAVHGDLVERTLATASAARAAGVVGAVELWCAPDAECPAFAAWRDRHGATLAVQRDGDLGRRMDHALRSALARGTAAILVGSDCPALDVDYLASAAEALAHHDAVFGPAEDGGYVLVGLSRAVAAFSGIAWGTGAVMASTRALLTKQRASWIELTTLWDVDEPADLGRWRGE